MKSNPFTYIATGLAAACLVPALALEAPEDEASPPPALDTAPAALPEIKLNADVAPKAETAFLGVVSLEVPELLAAHIGLQPGEGVIVRSLVPEGPAALAGVAVNDVIVKVAGQPVGSPLEISKQIAGHNPGEKISIDLIHAGKPTALDVTLGIRPADLAATQPQGIEQLDLDALPKEFADRIRDAIAGNVGALDLGGEAMQDLQKRMQGALGQGGFNLPGNDKLQLEGGATVRMRDNQGCVEMKAKDGAKEVTIRDQQDKVTWNGPWDTAQDKAAAPADVRERVESLNIDSTFKGGGLRLQMRQPAAPDAKQE